MTQQALTKRNTDTEMFSMAPAVRTLLADLGVSLPNVLRRASLPADLFARGTALVAPGEYFAFWQAIEEEAAIPDVPIAIGRAISAEVFDPPLFAALCSPNLRVAARRIAAYKPLIGPLRVTVTETARELTLDYVWPGQLQPPPVLAAAELVFWVALTRIATRSHVCPLRASAPAAPPNRQAYRDFLGVPIEAGAVQSITFSADEASRPFLTADEPMWAFFEPELRRRLSALEHNASITDRVRGALLELLPAGRATMAAVAHELAVSPRTLQRRLQDERTSFQNILNETRLALARNYLSSSTLSAGEIAFLLGYDDPNSFYRAFVSWTGQTPGSLRFSGA
jgi:AraC-like DNA-binding protein